MKKSGYVGLSLLLIVVLAAPLFSQAKQPTAKTRPEHDAYVAFYQQQDPQKKAEAGEKFLIDFKDSEFGPGVQGSILRAYLTLQNCGKAFEAADKIAMGAGATPDTKVSVYIGCMECAQATNNVPKLLEYGEKILAIDANNLNALLVLATTIPERLPAEEAAKQTALTKAEGYAKKALTGVTGLAKPAGVADAAWTQQKNDLLGQLHSSLGLINYTRTQYEPAVTEYLEAIKTTPKDWVARYRLGLSYRGMMPEKSKAYTDSVTAENEAKKNRAEQLVLDEMAARRQGFEEMLRALRDKAIDQFAFAVAIGAAQAQPARDELVKLYKQKNNDSEEGMEDLINKKKAEIGQ